VAVEALREMAKSGCGCVDDDIEAGGRHWHCPGCEARAALSAMERALTGEE
jgi:hypothetical protein